MHFFKVKVHFFKNLFYMAKQILSLYKSSQNNPVSIHFLFQMLPHFPVQILQNDIRLPVYIPGYPGNPQNSCVRCTVPD